MSYDQKCYDLAEAFLQDEPTVNTDVSRHVLAQAKIEEAFAHLGAILMQTATSDDKIIIGHVRDAHGLLQDALRAPSPRAPSEDDDWKDDPSADERWQAGLDFGLLELCAVLDVKPHDVTWDAATETLDGDVSAVIGNILRAKYGEDFDPTSPAPTAAPTLGREADCDCGAATSGKWSGIHSEGCSAMRETTGIDDVEWLDAKVVELSKENERLRAALTAPDKGDPDEREAFERWWIASGRIAPERSDEKPEEYLNSFIQLAWIAWQAARSVAPSK